MEKLTKVYRVFPMGQPAREFAVAAHGRKWITVVSTDTKCVGFDSGGRRRLDAATLLAKGSVAGFWRSAAEAEAADEAQYLSDMAWKHLDDATTAARLTEFRRAREAAREAARA